MAGEIPELRHVTARLLDGALRCLNLDWRLMGASVREDRETGDRTERGRRDAREDGETQERTERLEGGEY